MSRQLEQAAEDRTSRRRKEILIAVEFGLVEAIERSGAVMTGFAFKNRGSDCILVLKGHLAGKHQVAFVGSDDLGGCLIKAVRLGNGDQLRWRDDKYGG
jgi:hypothetical protein